MKTIAISEFKAHALEILNKIGKEQDTIIITKRGKPLAQVIPYQKEEPCAVPGKLSTALLFEKDIVSPLGEDMWDVCK